MSWIYCPIVNRFRDAPKRVPGHLLQDHWSASSNGILWGYADNLSYTVNAACLQKGANKPEHQASLTRDGFFSQINYMLMGRCMGALQYITISISQVLPVSEPKLALKWVFSAPACLQEPSCPVLWALNWEVSFTFHISQYPHLLILDRAQIFLQFSIETFALALAIIMTYLSVL